MRQSFSPAVTRAVEAARNAGPDFRSRDLLLGLMEEDGRVWELLERAGFSPAKFAEDLKGRPAADFPMGAGVLPRAQRAAYEAGREELTSEVVAHALFEDPSLVRILRDRPGDADGFLAALVPEEAPPIALDTPEGDWVVRDPAESHAAARILDANANRAREALRVIDDYCRFALEDAHLTAEAKRLRHDFAGAMGGFPAKLLMAARDTAGDIGTALGAPGEYLRESPAEVARVNCKRLQESLRSIEEFAKIDNPALARDFEQFRYRAYTLEKLLAGRRPDGGRLENVRLCVLLAAAECEAALDWTIAEAAAGGAGMFQLREKNLADAALLKRARDVRRWTRAANALFIVNDRPDIARLCEADGVHLGQDDLEVRDARAILGPDALIGVSTHDLEQVRKAVQDGANYLGVGPTFPSRTKSFDHFPGLEFIREVAAGTKLPAFAIGGVTEDNARAVFSAGGRRVAVGAGVARAADPRLAALAIRRQLDGDP